MRSTSAGARPLAALVAGGLAVGLTFVALEAQGRHPVSGRVIAPVMGVGGADWLERPEREREEATDVAVRALGLKTGQVVADIGAGSGYYAVRMAREVGPTGKVLAVDIQPGMLDLLQRNVARAGLENVAALLGAPEIRSCRPTRSISR